MVLALKEKLQLIILGVTMIKILFMGRKPVAVNLLKFIHDLDNVQIVGVLTDNHLEGSVTTKVANDLGLQIYTFNQALQAMRQGALSFDLGISMLYWRKLKDEFISLPRLGVINFHPAILPEYKGTAGYNLAILEGRLDWGVSAHYVDEEIDTGDIIEVKTFPIDYDKETVVTLEKKSVKVLEELAQKIIFKVVSLNGKLPARSNEGGRYISREEMERMKEIREGDDIERKIRAFWFPPYGGAYFPTLGKDYTLVSHFILDSLAPKDSTSLFSKEE